MMLYNRLSLLEKGNFTMRNKDNKHLGIEIDPALHYKLRYIATAEGRSINKQILYLIRQCVQSYESNNGSIENPAANTDVK